MAAWKKAKRGVHSGRHLFQYYLSQTHKVPMRKLPDLAWEVKKCFQEEGIAKTWWRRGCLPGDQKAAEVLKREKRATWHCHSSEGPERKSMMRQ